MTGGKAGALLAALTLGCSVDTADLRGFPDACDVREQCAPDYTCEEGRCVRAPGAECKETEPAVVCERRLGVCAQAARACVAGRVEEQCTAASYGEDFEEAETRCDGQDNDCDGYADARLWTVGDGVAFVLPQLVTREQGLAAVSMEMSATPTQTTWKLRYDALREDFTFAGAPLYLQDSSPTGDGVLVQVAPGAEQAVVYWHAYLAGRSPTARIARVSHPAGGAPALAVEARDLEVPTSAFAAPRAALAADGASVLVAWAIPAGVHVQRFSAALVPLGEPELLTPAPLLDGAVRRAVLDVAPWGPSGFIVGWASPDGSGSTVHLQALPGTQARTLSTPDDVTDLRLLHLLDGSGGRAAWLSHGAAGSSAVDWVEPFGTAPPARALQLPDTELDRLDASLSPGGTLLLTYPRGQAGNQDILLRSVSPQGVAHEQLLASGVPYWSTQLGSTGADRRVMGMTASDGRPTALRTCALP